MIPVLFAAFLTVALNSIAPVSSLTHGQSSRLTLMLSPSCPPAPPAPPFPGMPFTPAVPVMFIMLFLARSIVIPEPAAPPRPV